MALKIVRRELLAQNSAGKHAGYVRTRADQRHVARKHVQQLRKLIETCLAQDTPERRDTAVVSRSLSRSVVITEQHFWPVVVPTSRDLLIRSWRAAPTATRGAGSLYLFGPGDRLRIRVYDDANLTGEYEVNSSRQISFPLVGQVRLRTQPRARSSKRSSPV